MRHFLLFVLFCSAQHVFSQITITTNNLPDAGDTIITRNAAFTGEVDLEDTGANHVWSFDFDDLTPLNLNPGIICYEVDDIPFVFQFMFNNPFDADYNSDYGIGVEQASIATVTFENAYMYYQNNNQKYTNTGMSVSINGLPVASHMDDPDLIYRLPLTYDSADSSHSLMNFDVPQLGYYGLDQTRHYHCDGWGTLNIWEQSFDVLRVRSVVNGSDSIFTSFVNLGIRLPRPENITYEWISTEHIEPILKVTTTAGVVTQVQVADIYEPPTSVNEIANSKLSVYPNPANDLVFVNYAGDANTLIEIYDSQGRVVITEKWTAQFSQIDLSTLNSGIYTLRIQQNGKILSKNFVKN